MDEKRVVVKEQSLKNLADQVRIKAGTPDTLYDIDEMSEVVGMLGMPELEELNVTENGEYNPTVYGFSKVSVDVQPEREEINITENGEYIPNTYGFEKVTVDVQPALEELYVERNGEYTPTEYGYSKVIVDCPEPPPDEAFLITGDCKGRFTGWDWFINTYGKKIVTKDITNLEDCFKNANVNGKEIPFVINIKDCTSIANAFVGSKIKVCPKIRGTFITTRIPRMISDLGLGYVRDLNDLFELEMLDYIEKIKFTYNGDAQYGLRLYNGYSVRTVPAWFYKLKLNKESTIAPSSATLYDNTFGYCHVLAEALNIPVWTCTKPFTSNLFNNTYYHAYRLTRTTFETDNGVPLVANWKNQTISLDNYQGYTSGNDSAIVGYNSGITVDKKVTDDATYQALKNDPDWFTTKFEYSRYNLQSALETISSLPDTSACLAANGGTNTIKFKRNSGLYTDGGGITDDAIAAAALEAAKKGWTVTLVN